MRNSTSRPRASSPYSADRAAARRRWSTSSPGFSMPIMDGWRWTRTCCSIPNVGSTFPPEVRRIGYVFQDARLFPHLSVAANLRYAARRARAQPYVGFDAVAALLDLGFLMDRRVHRLSGGERQRVAIGRALLSQPRLLLLDEPLASLDAARREEVLPYLETLRDQLAIPMVYVSHNFDEVLRLATHIVLLEVGSNRSPGRRRRDEPEPASKDHHRRRRGRRRHRRYRAGCGFLERLDASASGLRRTSGAGCAGARSARNCACNCWRAISSWRRSCRNI